MTLRFGAAFLHAVALVVALAMLVPLGWLVLRAVEAPDVALDVLRSPDTLEVLWNSLSLALGVGVLCVLLALPLAWLTHATDLPGRRVFRLLFNLPLAVPSYVAGFVVVAVFGPMGWLRQWTGWPIPEVYGGFGTTLALLYAFPYALLPLQAALARTDPRTWEAARSLGASPARAFVGVVLPGLRPALAGGFLLVALYVLGDFGAVSLLRFESLSFVIYLRYQSLFDRAEAVPLGLLLVVVVLVLLLVRRAIAGQHRPALLARSGVRAWPVVPLGPWRWPAFALALLVVAFGVVLPVVTVLLWLVRGLAQGVMLPAVLGVTLRTLGTGALAALLVLLVAVTPALLQRHGHPAVARLTWAASHMGYALPGIVVALSLVFLGTTLLLPLYQTLPLLLFAYVVRFLPLGLGALHDGIAAQDPRLLEAARSLGSSPLSAWVRVLLPGLRPAIAAGLLAVFISTIKELPATLLLSPIGHSALSTRIWSLTEDAFFTAAAPPILLLLVLAGLALLLQPGTRVRPRGHRSVNDRS
ncbi:MAG: iron ABC transporter permease [Deltaproteobacteria bacterium]|nr:MAG: iron ABC transporter permease [Deltaproteobacteria bacterium]